jgi:hypothetical protein
MVRSTAKAGEPKSQQSDFILYAHPARSNHIATMKKLLLLILTTAFTSCHQETDAEMRARIDAQIAKADRLIAEQREMLRKEDEEWAEKHRNDPPKPSYHHVEWVPMPILVDTYGNPVVDDEGNIVNLSGN